MAWGLANSNFVNLISDCPLDTPGAISPQVPHFRIACTADSLAAGSRDIVLGHGDLVFNEEEGVKNRNSHD